MHTAIVIKGRVVDPHHVEVDQPIDAETSEVDVVVRPKPRQTSGYSLLDLIDSFPSGNRSAEDIVRQVREERDSWGDR